MITATSFLTLVFFVDRVFGSCNGQVSSEVQCEEKLKNTDQEIKGKRYPVVQIVNGNTFKLHFLLGNDSIA